MHIRIKGDTVGDAKRAKEAMKKAASEAASFEMFLSGIDMGVCHINAALGNLRHRLGAEAAIYKATLRRNQELEVELDRLRDESKRLKEVAASAERLAERAIATGNGYQRELEALRAKVAGREGGADAPAV